MANVIVLSPLLPICYTDFQSRVVQLMLAQRAANLAVHRVFQQDIGQAVQVDLYRASPDRLKRRRIYAGMY